jgi:hypothetical protein
MFKTTLLNSFTKIKTVGNKIYERLYNRVDEQIYFDIVLCINLGILVGSGIGSYKVIYLNKGKINTIENIMSTLSMAVCGGIVGGGFGCFCGYLYPYGLVVLPSTILSYCIYHKCNGKELILDDLSLTQKTIN